MNDLRTAAQQALEALEKAVIAFGPGLTLQQNAIDRLRAALAEPACCCGEPTAAGVVHRRDGPCYMAEPVQDKRTTVADLRDAMWLDPECADKGACQSLKFKCKAEPVQDQPTCDECGKHKRDGWALYCVGCVEPMFSDAAEPAGVPVGGHSAASTNTKLEEQAYRTCPKCSHPMFCAVKCDQCGRVFEDEAEAESITDAMMNLVDRLGSEADQVDPRAWHHLLVYAPKQKPSQEPVGWFGYDNSIGTWFETNEGDDDSVLLYTVPPQRKPLTDEEIADIYIKWDAKPGVSMADFARAIERAHGIGEQE